MNSFLKKIIVALLTLEARAVLRKPFGRDELLTIIRNLLGARQAAAGVSPGVPAA